MKKKKNFMADGKNGSHHLQAVMENAREDSGQQSTDLTLRAGHKIQLFGRDFNKIILVTHINIFLYAACFWIQTGTLPYLSKKLGVNPVMFGYLQTTFAVVQLAGGPLFGRFGDIFGGRAAMTLAFSASAITYLILSMSSTVPLLFLSRLPSVFMHAMQGGQMIVTDLGEEGKRADSLGKLGLSYGVGMVVGPAVGGLITKHLGEEASAFTAFLGSILSILLVLKFIPIYKKKAHQSDESSNSSSSSSSGVFSLRKWFSLIMAPGAFLLLAIRMASGVPIGVFESMFQVVALETFKLPPDQNGYIMSYIGILTMIVQGLGVGVLLKKFSENSILKWASFILIWSYLMLSYVTNVWQLYLVMAPLVTGLASQNIVISSALTKTVEHTDTGAMLGLNMAVNSLIRTMSPTVGGIMLSSYGFPAFGYFGFGISILVTSVLFGKLRD
ncbi:hypothetical protein CHS0354_001911 [Potamilus streckersoni]|uniref:Organic cation transporter-like protein 2 n=1 Tax=Potamilus streckersoni TaxID=2493646 RepID=A0AAE0VTM9_9BIVA|nr:hypothetical protein CHS0354_001911 [Potamilus streckersoni]